MTFSSSYWEVGKNQGLRNRDFTITQLLLVTLLEPFSKTILEKWWYTKVLFRLYLCFNRQ